MCTNLSFQFLLSAAYFNLTCEFYVQLEVSGFVAYCVHCAWLVNALAGQS